MTSSGVASTGSSSGLAVVVVEDVVAFAAAAVVVADVLSAAAADVLSAAAADVLSAAAAVESFPKIGYGPIGRDLLSVAEPVQSWGTYIVGTVAVSAEGYVICIVAAA